MQRRIALLTEELAKKPEDWPASVVRKSDKLLSKEFDFGGECAKEELKCSVIPSWASVSGRSAEEIAALAPKKLHYKKDMCVFGMTLTDGTKTIGGNESWTDETADMPENLTKIEVCFTKHESSFHHIVFIGSTTVYMGLTKEDDEGRLKNATDMHAGRVETVVLAPGEQLLGCEMYHDGYNTFGVTFLIWKAV